MKLPKQDIALSRCALPLYETNARARARTVPRIKAASGLANVAQCQCSSAACGGVRKFVKSYLRRSFDAVVSLGMLVSAARTAVPLCCKHMAHNTTRIPSLFPRLSFSRVQHTHTRTHTYSLSFSPAAFIPRDIQQESSSGSLIFLGAAPHRTAVIDTKSQTRKRRK